MFFGSDWLANLYMGCFLFGLIFTSLSLVLNFGHLGGDVSDHGAPPIPGAAHGAGVGHVGGHVDVHGAHVGGHVDVHGADVNGHAGHVGGHDVQAAHASHGGNGQGHGGAEDLLQGLSPLNMPTLLAFVTWFGGAGYIFRATLGWGAFLTTALALVSGLLGGWIVFMVLSYLLSRGQTPPMRRADYYLPGTRARVISGIAAGNGTGEIVFLKGGVRRVEGARSVNGEGIARGAEVVIERYENGLAYVLPIGAVTDLPPPTLARVEDTQDNNTQPLAESGTALTRDLRN